MLTLGGGEMGGDGMTCCRGTLKGARQDAGLDKMFQISFTGAPQKTFSFDIDCSPQLPLFNLHSLSPPSSNPPVLSFSRLQLLSKSIPSSADSSETGSGVRKR